jgi:hypothetical protein
MAGNLVNVRHLQPELLVGLAIEHHTHTT